ncbi:MAG: putative phospholipid ABC transporter permease protein MlaE [Gemmatimonadaceae bacterium]|nr:putative phospholipid ABC transporter permease protein MlaE [Gemmatimonadaceae bacterium]
MRSRALIESLGRYANAAVEGLGRTGRFAADTGRAVVDVGTWAPVATFHARTLGVGSLPIASYIAMFTGVVLALLASYAFTRAVPLYFVGTLVQKTITMELAPVLTGLALAGRVGAKIAAELGTMKVTEQIDALETLTYDPFAYLVLPRVLAGTVMFPVVVGIAMVVGIGAGWLASVALLDLTTVEFFKGARLFFLGFDVEYGLVKSASFGAVVTFIGCREGMLARGGAEGVGQAATRTVVYSAVMILVLDAFWAVVWLLGRQT